MGGAVDKAFDVLEALVEHGRLADIAAATGLPKATVHRILQVMVARGLARPTGDGGYVGGPRLFVVAGRVMHRLDLPAQVRPHLEELQRRTGRTVHLALLAGDEAVYAAKVESGKPYRLASRVGMSLHLHCTSIGKAMLAAMTDEQVVAVAGRTGLPRRTPNTITEVAPLLADVAGTRVGGAVTPATLTYEAAEPSNAQVGPDVVETARRVSKALGFTASVPR
jgi:IclR family transcriptional regulator, acetate operon repressor